MRLRINTSHHSQPEGGWGYVIPDGPTLSSSKTGEPGLRELLKKIVEHRANNGLPAGDPEHDVAMVYATKCPWLVTEEPDIEVLSNDPEPWIHHLWRSHPLKRAETRVRDERFEQCQKCIHFEPLDTDSLTDEAARRLLLMNPAKHRIEHGWCLLRGWIPSVAVQIMDPWEFADWTKKDPCCWLDTEPKKAT